jgi:hypothetical protein
MKSTAYGDGFQGASARQSGMVTLWQDNSQHVASILAACRLNARPR